MLIHPVGLQERHMKACLSLLGFGLLLGGRGRAAEPEHLEKRIAYWQSQLRETLCTGC